jgi:TRAP transporter 4TM/12TM fusion protein
MSEELRAKLIHGLALVFSLFQLIVPVFVPLYDMQLRAIHVLLSLSLIYLMVPMGKKTSRSFVFTLLAIPVIIVSNLIIFINWEEIITYPGSAETIHLVLGGALTLLLLEASRRAAGWAIPLCVVFMFIYVFIGPIIPGIWKHPGFPLDYVIGAIYYSSQGIYGSLTGTSATFIALFILFGALLSVTGGGRTFIDLAMLLAGRFKGGPAKVAVVASAMFGMISGSAVANVSVTGNYTIPLMKRLGYDSNFAGGVEAISSTGGGITPPVMGISAFIMADWLGIPYLKVIGYAIIPCILFYTGIMAGVHFEAQRIGLVRVPESEIPSWRTVLTWSRIMPLLVPIVVLLVMLFRGYSLMSAGFYACAATILLYLFSDFSVSGMKERLNHLAGALSEGGVSVAKIAPLLVSVGVFTCLLGLTGVAPKISTLILEMGHENLIGSLLVGAIIPLVLGAPLPVVATYILSAALIAPALVRLKIDLIAVHMFLLYWATFASVTPPTCTACVVGANLGGGHWVKVAYVAMRLGIIAFLLPFFFALNPSLIARGDPVHILMNGATGFAGAILMAAGFFGYMRTRLGLVLRGVYLAAGVMLLVPNPGLSLGGILLAAGGLFFESFQLKRLRRENVTPGGVL